MRFFTVFIVCQHGTKNYKHSHHISARIKNHEIEYHTMQIPKAPFDNIDKCLELKWSLGGSHNSLTLNSLEINFNPKTA